MRIKRKHASAVSAACDGGTSSEVPTAETDLCAATQPPSADPGTPAFDDESTTGARTAAALNDAERAPEDSGGCRRRRQPRDWRRPVAFAVMPALALTLAVAAGVLKYLQSSSHDNQLAAIEATQVARDGTAALLTYQPDKVEQQLNSARDLATGTFRDSYTDLIRDVVIPGAKQKQIAAAATVPAAATVSATARHVVVLVFVNQTVVVGKDAPAQTTSAVRVTLDRIGGRWLIAQFDPI